MTEQQLQVLEEQAKIDHTEADGGCETCFGWTQSALGLIDEVRRLRAVVKRLEWGSCDGCGIRDMCTECGARRSTLDETTWQPLAKHHPNCPVFAENGEVR